MPTRDKDGVSQRPLDATGFAAALAAARAALRAVAGRVDSLNVFPVPDGDTGTNLALTIAAAAEGAATSDADGLGGRAAAAADAALKAARGNSGVIFSQWLAGLAEGLAGASADGPALAEALSLAAREARRAVLRPLEGTILTAMTEAAKAAALSRGGPAARLFAAASAARRSVPRTRQLRPELTLAGVVDAGALGFAVALEAMAASLSGAAPRRPPASRPPSAEWRRSAAGGASPLGRCVLFTLAVAPEAEALLRARLESLASSLLVARHGAELRVHAHAGAVEPLLTAVRDLAEPGDVVVCDLDADARLFLGEQPRTAVVAVATGAGWRRLFADLGAVVVDGASEDVNAEVRAVIEARGARDTVLVLPASDDARPPLPARLRALFVESPPAALVALLAFSGDESGARNLRAMAAAAARTRTWRLGRHWRRDAAWEDLLRQLAGRPPELVTVFRGAPASPRAAQALAAALRSGLPGARVEVVEGGQPEPAFLVSVEE
jgi:hypothetical protein